MSLLGSHKQQAGDNSTQNSAGRDIVHHGISIEQMGQIMAEITRQVGAQVTLYSNVASQTFEARMEAFRQGLFQRFADERTTDKSAFEDPDFQMVVGGAAKSYARSGDDKLGAALIDMIASRSRLQERSRELLALNLALERVPLLTKNELAALSICFIFRHSVNQHVGSVQAFAEYVRPIVNEFLPDLTTDDASFRHITACGCGDIELGEVRFQRVITESYGGLFSKGFTREDALNHMPENERSLIDAAPLCACINDPTKLQLNALNKTVAVGYMVQRGLSESTAVNLGNLYAGTVMSQDEVIEKLQPFCPKYEEFVRVWDGSSLKNLRLNATGLAIGHASFVRLTGDPTPRSVWIK